MLAVVRYLLILCCVVPATTATCARAQSSSVMESGPRKLPAAAIAPSTVPAPGSSTAWGPSRAASRSFGDLPQRFSTLPAATQPSSSTALRAEGTPSSAAASPSASRERFDFQRSIEFGPNDPPHGRPYTDDTYLDWTPQFLPSGLIYRSYLAGSKESRFATIFENQKHFGWIWDITLGGRVALFRFGTMDPVRPEGFEIDLEGSGQPRLNLNDSEDLIAADFRAGIPITYGIGRWQSKFAYYHLSSHLGDEYLLKNPGFRRVNYSRDAFVLGQSYYLTDDVRLYGEVGWAFYSDVSKPWEFQFGIDYSPLLPIEGGGAPYVALNGQLRQELNFSGNFVVQAGWQWRGGSSGQLVRIGLEYYNGMSNQFQLYDVFENKLGFGIWYDF